VILAFDPDQLDQQGRELFSQLDPDVLAALRGMTDVELAACIRMYSYMQSRKQAPKRAARLTRIIKAARKARLLMSSDRLPDLDNAIATYKWFADPKGDPPVEGIKLKRVVSVTLAPEIEKLSAFEVVAGWCLADIFENHTGKSAGYTREPASNAVHGSFIDFAEIALILMDVTNSGAPYSRRSIADAWAKCQRLRNR
jgi:hypothetical protein